MRVIYVSNNKITIRARACVCLCLCRIFFVNPAGIFFRLRCLSLVFVMPFHQFIFFEHVRYLHRICRWCNHSVLRIRSNENKKITNWFLGYLVHHRFTSVKWRFGCRRLVSIMFYISMNISLDFRWKDGWPIRRFFRFYSILVRWCSCIISVISLVESNR